MNANTGIRSVAPQAPGVSPGLGEVMQQMGSAPSGGSPTGIAPSLEGVDDKRMLAMAVLGQVPQVPPALALGRLNKLVEAEKMRFAAQGQQAMAQNTQAQQQPPVAQQVLAQALSTGIGSQPVEFASGGLVAFAGGGSGSQEERDREAILNGLAGIGMTVEKLAAAGYDVSTMPVRALARVYNTLIRGPRAFGVPIPFVLKEFGTKSMTPAYDRLRAREERNEPAPGAGRSAGIGGPTAEQLASITAPMAAPRPPASDIIPTDAPPLRTGSDVPLPGIPPGSSGSASAAAQPSNSFEEYIKALQADAATTPEELEAREALKKQRQKIYEARTQQVGDLRGDLEARLAAIGKRPRGLEDAAGLLGLGSAMLGAKTFSEGLGKAAGVAGERLEGFRKEDIERADKLRTEKMSLMRLEQVNQDYETAIIEQRLAYASGDATRIREADQKVAKAKYEKDLADRNYQLEKYKAESSRISAEAKETASTGAKPMSDYQRAELKRKVDADVDKNLSMLHAAHLVEAKKNNQKPMSRSDFREAEINKRLNATPGYGDGTAPTAGQKVVDFSAIGTK